MPAFVNSRLGAVGIREADGTTVCCFDLKKSRNDWRISALVIFEGRIRHEKGRSEAWQEGNYRRKRAAGDCAFFGKIAWQNHGFPLGLVRTLRRMRPDVDAAGKAVDYRFLEINPAFARQTGLQNAEGRRMRELAPDHEEHWFEIYGRVALTGETVRFSHEAQALGRHYDVCAYRVGGPDSRKVAILFNDTTGRKGVDLSRPDAAENSGK
jgi:hypothetical protein